MNKSAYNFLSLLSSIQRNKDILDCKDLQLRKTTIGLQWQMRVINRTQSWIIRCKIRDKNMKMMKTAILSSPEVSMIIALSIKTISLAILTNIISPMTVAVTSPNIAQMMSMTIIEKNSVTSGQQ